MATIKPFSAVRPAISFADQMLSLPYDVMNRAEAAEMAKGKPYSFLHICRSEIDLMDQNNPYDPSVYEKAKETLDAFLAEGVLIQDGSPGFYVYRLTMNGRSQTGLVACTSIDEYLDQTIKKHEFTRVEKELDRIRHFDVCNANTEPVFLTYRNRAEIRTALNDWVTAHTPVYDLMTADGIGHTLWLLDDSNVIEYLIQSFAEIPSLYIADGHHRTASAVKVGLSRRDSNPAYKAGAESDYFMAVLFPDTELQIFDYNRVVKDLNGLSLDGFLAQLGTKFLVEERKTGPYGPEGKHVFSMYLYGTWYRLTALEGILTDHVIDGLDVSILQTHVLAPLLGIDDPRTDKRIDFVGGIRGLEELERRVQLDMAVAFALYPVSIEELLAVSDQGLVMPPKSTWFEPKLGSGLFVHLL